MKNENVKIIAYNRKAKHDYEILDEMEAGMALTGTEVKSLRAGKVNLKDSYVTIRNGELFAVGIHISPYEMGNRFNHEPERIRKLLMHKHEITRLKTKISQDGLTLVPLSLYFKKGIVKMNVALARGKKLYDKRESIKEREVNKAIKMRLSH